MEDVEQEEKIKKFPPPFAAAFVQPPDHVPGKKGKFYK